MYYEYGFSLTRVKYWSKISLIEVEMNPTELALLVLQLEESLPNKSSIFIYPPLGTLLSKLLIKYLRVEINLKTNILRCYSLDGTISTFPQVRNTLRSFDNYLVLIYHLNSRCIDYISSSITDPRYFTKLKKVKSLHDLNKLRFKLGIT